DQACVDAVYASTDPGKAALIERMESRHGIHTVEVACALGVGTREYEMISLD
ncbi:MAG: ferredoxin, partial [Clostridiales bacterium]|nr:ferredoxin [Clostridiales bacterium]